MADENTRPTYEELVEALKKQRAYLRYVSTAPQNGIGIRAAGKKADELDALLTRCRTGERK